MDAYPIKADKNYWSFKSTGSLGEKSAHDSGEADFGFAEDAESLIEKPDLP